MIELSIGNEQSFPTKPASVKDGLIERKPLKASNDRPLVQVDQRQQWSDYAVIPGYEKGIPGNPSTLP